MLQRNLKHINKSLLVISVIFAIFGLIMIFSASSMESVMRYDRSPYAFFKKQAIFVAGGIIIFGVMVNIPLKFYDKIKNVIIAVPLLLLLWLCVNGHVSHNAQSWLDLGFFKLQPSELVKIAVIIYFAFYYGSHELNSLKDAGITLLWLTVFGFLIISEPDYGTALIVMTIIVLMYFGAKMDKKFRVNSYKAFGVAMVIMAGLLIFANDKILKSYHLERFNYHDPCERYREDTGYQLCNSFIAFHNGGISGQGIGESTQKYMYLPDSYTDFIYPIIVEEWGMVVGILVLLMYGLLLAIIFNISKKCMMESNRMLCYGVFVYISLHVVINLVGVTGVAPLTGVPLPFLSYGGTFAICLFISLSLVQRVCIEEKMRKKVK